MFELNKAPLKVKNLIDTIPTEFIETVHSSEESQILANEYLLHKAISPKSSDDAMHIAIASVANVDILASWNFKHIVNVERILKYNSVNLYYGYKSLEIRSPKEVISYE